MNIVPKTNAVGARKVHNSGNKHVKNPYPVTGAMGAVHRGTEYPERGTGSITGATKRRGALGSGDVGK